MSEREWVTRKERIDTRLRGIDPPWKIVPFREALDTRALDRTAETEYPTANGPANNALFAGGEGAGQVDMLTQAILEKAFRGEWVPQDPNDELAEKLLARIRAAKHEEMRNAS